MPKEEKMHVWSVTVPIAGHAIKEVEAATEEEAIEKAVGGLPAHPPVHSGCHPKGSTRQGCRT